jgi:hypothetical protein
VIFYLIKPKSTLNQGETMPENTETTESTIKRIASQLKNQEFEEEEEIGVLDEDALDDELSSEVQFDVFEDIINPRITKGDQVKYDIYVDQVRVASSLTHPNSWGRIHEEFAPQGGYVMVKSRNGQGKWLKQQGMTFGKYKNAEDSQEAVNKQTGFTPRDFMEMQAKQEEKLEKLLRDQKITLEQAAKEKLDLVSTLMTQNANKPDTSMEMFKFMMTMQQQAQQQYREDMRRADEIRREDKREADERFEKLLLAMNSKEKEIDPYQEMERYRQAEDRGYQRAMEFNQLLEEKAESKALRLAEQNKDESVTDKALKSILGTLPQVAGILNKRTAGGVPTTQNNPVPRSIPNRPQQVAPTLGGMARIDDESQEVDQQANNAKINEEEVRKQRIIQARTKILELTLPTIGADLLAESNYVETADKVCEILADKNINPLLVTKLFTVDDFFAIADDQGIVDIARESGKLDNLKDWLKGFYKSVYEKASSSQPRQSV